MNQPLKYLRLPYEYIVFYGGLLGFALLCLSWSLIPAPLLYLVLPRRTGTVIGQFIIMAGFRSFVLVLQASGLVQCDLEALDVLRRDDSLVITSNHPSLIDIVLLASRLPRAVCVMKAKICDSFLLGGGARLAGYIKNDSPNSLIHLAAQATRNGSQLLIFPEGTRTLQPPINEFKGGFALIAKTARVPIQTVFIETNSPFLGKGWPMLQKPDFPLIYRARLGQRFEVSGDVKTFVGNLENYYRQELKAPFTDKQYPK